MMNMSWKAPGMLHDVERPTPSPITSRLEKLERMMELWELRLETVEAGQIDLDLWIHGDPHEDMMPSLEAENAALKARIGRLVDAFTDVVAYAVQLNGGDHEAIRVGLLPETALQPGDLEPIDAGEVTT
jgi:hypothetical protein